MFISGQLVDKLDDVINSGSETVNEFFDNAFFINEQFATSKALKWCGEDNEKIVAVPSAFLIDSEIQKSIMQDANKAADEDEENEEMSDEYMKVPVID